MISLRKLFGLSRGLLRVARPALFQNHLLYQQRVYFAKISKKKEEKLQKTKQKEQARGKVGNTKQIDLKSMERDFQIVGEAVKSQLTKMKLGRLDPIVFSEVFIKAYGDTTTVAELSQVVQKNPTTCIVSPYHEDHVITIQKGLETSEHGFTVTRKDNQLIVSQANSSTKQAKQILLKKVKKLHEDTRERVRKLRTKFMDDIKPYKKFAQEDAVKRAESEVQKMFENLNRDLDHAFKAKEKELS